MTEREKMLAGELYDCGDKELLTQWHKAKNLTRDYNNTDSENLAEKDRILSELLGGRGKNLWITAPFYVDYGNNIYFGNNCEVNMNCTFLDDNKIVIGNNALIAPNVQIYTAFHPTNARERFGEPKPDGSFEFILQNQNCPGYHWGQCMDRRRSYHYAGRHHRGQRGYRRRKCRYQRYSKQCDRLRQSLPHRKKKRLGFATNFEHPLFPQDLRKEGVLFLNIFFEIKINLLLRQTDFQNRMNKNIIHLLF